MIANAEDFNRHWPTWIGLQPFEKKPRRRQKVPAAELCDQLDDQYMPITFHQAIPTVIQITVLMVVMMKPFRHHSPCET